MKGNILKARIIEKKMTIKECAELVELDEQTISNWINERNIFYITKFLKLLCLLEINPCDIVDIKKRP